MDKTTKNELNFIIKELERRAATHGKDSREGTDSYWRAYDAGQSVANRVAADMLLGLLEGNSDKG